MVPRAAARTREALEVPAPRHAPSTDPALSMRSGGHAPLAPAVRPARGHEDVVTVHNLPTHAASEVEIGPAVRLPASFEKYGVINQIRDREIVQHFESIKSSKLWYLMQLPAYCRTRRVWTHNF